MKRRKFMARFESAPPRPRRVKKDHQRVPSNDHQGHTPCPECGQFLVMAHAPRCFHCEPKDPVFELLDALIAANVQYSRQYLEMHQEAVAEIRDRMATK